MTKNLFSSGAAPLETSLPARVLVVDDEPMVLETIAAILSRQGYEVVTADSVKQALEHLHAGRFDVVLTDLRLDGTNGLSLLTELRRNWPQTMAIMITGDPRSSRRSTRCARASTIT